VHQDFPNAGWIPVRSTGRRRNAAVDQTLGDAVQRQSVFDVPGEDLAHDVSGVLIDVHTGWISRSVWILAIAEWRHGPGHELTSAKCRQATRPHSVGDDGALILGDDAADLNDEHILRIAGRRPLKKDHLHARTLELFEQPNLVGVPPSEPVWAGDQHHID